jgi:hypothetical protein
MRQGLGQICWNIPPPGACCELGLCCRWERREGGSGGGIRSSCSDLQLPAELGKGNG